MDPCRRERLVDSDTRRLAEDVRKRYDTSKPKISLTRSLRVRKAELTLHEVSDLVPTSRDRDSLEQSFVS